VPLLREELGPVASRALLQRPRHPVVAVEALSVAVGKPRSRRVNARSRGGKDRVSSVAGISPGKKISVNFRHFDPFRKTVS
jgi:hypothetical protein